MSLGLYSKMATGAVNDCRGSMGDSGFGDTSAGVSNPQSAFVNVEISDSASAGASMSRQSGGALSNARSKLRAEPGP